MLQKPKVDPQEQIEDSAMLDRRLAVKAIARYAAYTTPAMAVILSVGEAEAGARRKRYGWFRRHWKGRKHHYKKPPKAS